MASGLMSRRPRHYRVASLRPRDKEAHRPSAHTTPPSASRQCLLARQSMYAITIRPEPETRIKCMNGRRTHKQQHRQHVVCIYAPNKQSTKKQMLYVTRWQTMAPLQCDSYPANTIDSPLFFALPIKSTYEYIWLPLGQSAK